MKSKVIKQADKSASKTASIKTQPFVPSPSWTPEVQAYFKDWTIYNENKWSKCSTHLVSDPNCCFDVANNEIPDYYSNEVPLIENKTLLKEFDKDNELICSKIFIDPKTKIKTMVKFYIEKDSNTSMTINQLYDKLKSDMDSMEAGIRSDMATKQDLTDMETNIREDMTTMETNIRSDMATMENKLVEKIDVVDAKVDNLTEAVKELQSEAKDHGWSIKKEIK